MAHFHRALLESTGCIWKSYQVLTFVHWEVCSIEYASTSPLVESDPQRRKRWRHNCGHQNIGQGDTIKHSQDNRYFPVSGSHNTIAQPFRCTGGDLVEEMVPVSGQRRRCGQRAGFGHRVVVGEPADKVFDEFLRWSHLSKGKPRRDPFSRRCWQGGADLTPIRDVTNRVLSG
jgi:hypothetical protein